ncbi:MAG TPA: heparan-alpha-glucosaminide N-acetyltransferase domain-containing protein [Bacteroidetes bacterium]|nr:heparan-alpha-glucosaminide N-acetyltransferase domain-containing protein [Bacteroidota bacterium]
MKRLLSLDILRGLTVACMIMVNNPGSWGHMYPPLKHYIWDGCSPTDLVFPTFLFIVGASIWFAMRRFDQKLSKSAAIKIIKRGILIFLVGELLKMYPFYNLETFQIRGFGVLQRIGIAYTLGALIALWLRSYKKIAICVVSLLVGYHIIVFAFGDATIEGYLGRKIDLAVFGEERLPMRLGFHFAAEGLLSTLGALSTVLIGYMAGKFIGSRHSEDKNHTLQSFIYLAAIGGLMITAGLIWNGFFPINKPMWSSSYVLYAAGIAMQLWALTSYLTDYLGKTSGLTTFFRVFGTNALFAFALSSVIVRTIKLPPFLWEAGGKTTSLSGHFYSYFASLTGNPELASLLWSLVMVALCWAITYPLYRKKIFIKL